MPHIIVITDTPDIPQSTHPATEWIAKNAPFFLKDGHEVLRLPNPTDEQLRTAAVTILMKPEDYFRLIGRGMDQRNFIILSNHFDARESQHGSGAKREAIRLFDGLIRAARAVAAHAEAECVRLTEECARLTADLAAAQKPAATSPAALPHAVSEDPPMAPKRAAEIEFEAGAAIAKAGGTLIDAASPAARDGFASVASRSGVAGSVPVEEGLAPPLPAITPSDIDKLKAAVRRKAKPAAE